MDLREGRTFPLVLAASLAWSAIAGVPLSARQAIDEYDVKAAFLLNLAKFVEWPAIHNPTGTFDVCIYGDDPFGPALDRAVDGKSIQGGDVRVRRLENAESASLCRIAFVRGEEVRKAQELLSAVGNAPVLTVGERREFVESGGVVQLDRRDRKVVIVVNKRAADRSGLDISSKLMALAEVVD
jgi:hypothetical protein